MNAFWSRTNCSRLLTLDHNDNVEIHYFQTLPRKFPETTILRKELNFRKLSWLENVFINFFRVIVINGELSFTAKCVFGKLFFFFENWYVLPQKATKFIALSILPNLWVSCSLYAKYDIVSMKPAWLSGTENWNALADKYTQKASIAMFCLF